MAKTLFDHLKQITGGQDINYFETLTEEDMKSFNRYMLLRFLSMNREWIDHIAYIQPYVQELPPKIFYKLMISFIPGNGKFLKYVSGKKKDVWYEDWIIDLVSEYYECGMHVALDYLDVYYASIEGKRHLRELCEAHGVDSKKIRKLKLGV